MEHHLKMCGGLTKHGKPCNITWGLDSLGYCKYHSPAASQCRGIARSTGRRCNIKWDLNDGFCTYHQQQSTSATRRCIGKIQRTGRRCQADSGIDDEGYCPVHQERNDETPRCQGFFRNSTKRCTKQAKPDYDYCCSAHDPSLLHISPRVFDSEVLSRAAMEDQVVARYDGRDLYHAEALDLVTPKWVELDHILEKQCFSYALQFLNFRDDEDKDFVAAFVRDEVVNTLPNLCLTRTATNRIKGASVWKFLDDCITGHVGYRGNGATFNSYMLAENRDRIRLGRSTTRVIIREMGSSLKKCQRQLAEQGETPMLDALSAELQQLYVTMELRSSRRRD